MADFSIKVKKTLPDAILPTKGSPYSAGYDLYACDYSGNTMGGNWVLMIRPHETIKINTGLAMALPDGVFGAIFARSGIATHQGLRPANCVG